MSKKARLEVRQAKFNDIEGIHRLVSRAYEKMGTYPLDTIRGQINNFPEGHFVALLNNEIIGYSASIVLPEKEVLKSHNWKTITGQGFGTTHDPSGDYLYGYETCVDPNVRGHRIGQRLYSERKKLVKFLRLKGVVFGGRLPNLSQHIEKAKNIKNYIKLVKNKKIKDPVLGFHLRNGFEVIGVLENYLPLDKASLGHAVHLRWKNPQYESIRQIKKGRFRQDSV